MSKKNFESEDIMSEALRCCLCQSMIEKDGLGWDKGNNPWPLRKGEDDRCCDTCNDTVVVPTRIMMLSAKKTKEELQ